MRYPITTSLELVAMLLIGLTAQGTSAQTRAQTPARVELELFLGRGVSMTSAHSWSQRLSRAGVRSRVRSARNGDRVGIETRESGASRTHVVTGEIVSEIELSTPGGRFRAGRETDLVEWLDQLARVGPEGLGKEPEPLRFGLEPDDFQQIREDLTRPVEFSTKGMPRAEFIRRLAPELGLPIEADRSLLAAAQADPIAEELLGLSAGTALACVARPLGACLVPRRTASGLAHGIVPGKPEMEIWPIGWESDLRPGQVAPGMLETLTANVQNVPITQVLEAVATKIEVAVLMDHNAMARHGIEPETSKVSVPAGRTTYINLLYNSLTRVGLKSELRVDELGKPLLWVSTIKPLD